MSTALIPVFSKHRVPLHMQLSPDLSLVTLKELGLEESGTRKCCYS